MNKVIYGVLLLAGLLLFISGILSALVAGPLSCAKANPVVDQVWKALSAGAAIGIVGPLLLLMMQAFIHRKDVTKSAVDFLTTEYKPIRKPEYSHMDKKSSMPSYNPPQYKKAQGMY